MQNPFLNNSIAGLSVCLCLMTLFWSIYLLRYRKSGRDRALLGLMGIVSVYQGYQLLTALGLWAAATERSGQFALLCATALHFLAVYVIGRWGVEHRVAQTQVRVLEDGASLPTSGSWGEASPELLAAALHALPFSVSITNQHGKVLFQNRNEAGSASPVMLSEAWSGAVGHEAAGCSLRFAPRTAVTTLPEPVLPPVRQAADDPTRDRRRQLRLPVGHAVRVETLDGSIRNISGQTLDFSGEGIGLLLPKALPAGTAALVHLGDNLVIGRVRHCQEASEGFRIGIQVDQFLADNAETATVTARSMRQAGAAGGGPSWQLPSNKQLVAVTSQFGRAE